MFVKEAPLSERDVVKLCASLNPVMAQPVYVYCSFIDFSLPAGLTAFCTVREGEGLTAVVKRSDAEQLGLPYTFESRLITLSVHSSFEAVGFIPAISRTLAQAGTPAM